MASSHRNQNRNQLGGNGTPLAGFYAQPRSSLGLIFSHLPGCFATMHFGRSCGQRIDPERERYRCGRQLFAPKTGLDTTARLSEVIGHCALPWARKNDIATTRAARQCLRIADATRAQNGTMCAGCRRRKSLEAPLFQPGLSDAQIEALAACFAAQPVVAATGLAPARFLDKGPRRQCR